MEDNKKSNNVIRFPGRQARPTDSDSITQQIGSAAARLEPIAELTSRAEASEVKSTPWNKQLRPALLSILAVISVTYFGNRFAPQTTELGSVSNGRVIASLDDRGFTTSDRDEKFENELSKRLKSRAFREVASVRMGHRPTAEEKLRFDVLQGQYSVLFREGKLSEVRLPSGAGESRIYLKDAEAFLKDNRQLMPVEFSSVISENRQTSTEGVFETYSLISNAKTKVGEVRVGRDQFGRLLSLSVANLISTR